MPELSGEDAVIFLDQAKVMGKNAPEGVKKLIAAMERLTSRKHDGLGRLADDYGNSTGQKVVLGDGSYPAPGE